MNHTTRRAIATALVAFLTCVAGANPANPLRGALIRCDESALRSRASLRAPITGSGVHVEGRCALCAPNSRVTGSGFELESGLGSWSWFFIGA